MTTPLLAKGRNRGKWLCVLLSTYMLPAPRVFHLARASLFWKRWRKVTFSWMEASDSCVSWAVKAFFDKKSAWAFISCIIVVFETMDYILILHTFLRWGLHLGGTKAFYRKGWAPHVKALCQVPNQARNCWSETPGPLERRSAHR